LSVPDLFIGFARVGVLGFGGGPSMIPLMQAECVNAGWVTEAQFLEGLAVGNALPGPIATKMAVYVGWHEAGAPGLLAAVLGVTLPSLVLMATLSGLLLTYRDHKIVAGVLSGVRPAVVGMLAFVAYDLAPAGIVGWSGALLAFLAFGALVMKVHPAVVMIGAMTLGGLFFRP
jgi:chromate transporter